MSMKKTDLEKHLAKKLDGKLKSGTIPQRFGQGAKAVAAKPRPNPRRVRPNWCNSPANCPPIWRNACATAP
jgi:hypothetical protein